MKQTENREWEHYVGKNLEISTHNTYHGRDCNFEGELTEVIWIGKDAYLVLTADDEVFHINTRWIISFTENRDED